MKRPPLCVLCASALLTGGAPAGAQIPWDQYRKNSEEWFGGEEGRRAADNILSWQSPRGSWPKNTDTSANAFAGEKEKLQGTFDNRATTDEMRFLARAFRATRDPRYEAAFLRGLDHILQAQYPNGGWPQVHPPPRDKYPRHITFNDNAMVRLLELLREVAVSGAYDFVDASRRAAAKESFDRGVQCILQCQLVVGGKRTAWCAQHDEADFSPRPARSFEPASLSGAESAWILQFLMTIEPPSPEIAGAIQAGAAWFEAVQLLGIRVKSVDGDKEIVQDPAAPPLWARFYEIGTNRPIFAGRDGVKKYALFEIEAERRNGYAWYGSWGEGVARDFARWKEQWGEKTR